MNGANVFGNTANLNGDQGIAVLCEVPGAVSVRSNVTNQNNGDGILFEGPTAGNVIRYNKASGTVQGVASEWAVRWLACAVDQPRTGPEQEQIARLMYRSSAHLRMQVSGAFL